MHFGILLLVEKDSEPVKPDKEEHELKPYHQESLIEKVGKGKSYGWGDIDLFVEKDPAVVIVYVEALC